MAKKPTKEKGPKFTKLTRLQTVQLFNWITDNPVFAKTHTPKDLAALATTALGFPVSKSSCDTLRKEMGIEVAVVREPKRKVTFAIIKMMAREVANLLKKMGEPVSQELEDLAK